MECIPIHPPIYTPIHVCYYMYTYMWQSQVEIKHYSIAYFDYVTAFKAL